MPGWGSKLVRGPRFIRPVDDGRHHRHVGAANHQRDAGLHRFQLAGGGPRAFGEDVQHPAFVEQANDLFHRPDIAFALLDRKRVQRANQPRERWEFEQIGAGQVREGATQFDRQDDRVEIALVVGDDQHPAGGRNVFETFDFQIEKHARPDGRGNLQPAVQWRAARRTRDGDLRCRDRPSGDCRGDRSSGN